MMIVELLKHRLHNGSSPNLYFWRDTGGLEVDCIIEKEGIVSLVEFKSTQTLTSFASGNLKKVQKIMSHISAVPYIVYGGNKSFYKDKIQILTWQQVTSTVH